MVKKVLCFIAATVMTAGVLCGTTAGAEFRDEADTAYSSGGGIFWFNPEAGEITEYEGEVGALVIPESLGGITVRKIGTGAFSDCKSLTSVSMPSVTEIRIGAFFDCDALESIDMPLVEVVGDAAFAGCVALREVELPNLKSFGKGVFTSCESLFEIKAGEGSESFSSVDGVLFDKSKTKLVCYPPGKRDVCYKVPDGVAEIGDMAFYMCGNLWRVEMPSVVRIGKEAFCDCDYLRDIEISNAIEIGDNAFLRRGDCFGLDKYENVYYGKSEKDREKINVGKRNEQLLEARWSYESAMPETEDLIKVSVDGEYIESDWTPAVENGRVLLPMRMIFEALGAEIRWEDEEMRAAATKDGKEIFIAAGSDRIIINGEEKPLDCAARMIGGRVYISESTVREALGADVLWSGAEREVVIRSDDKEP